MGSAKKLLVLTFLFLLTGVLTADPSSDLLAAVDAGDLAGVEAACKAGAKPDGIEDKGGWTPMMYAAYDGNLEIIKYLVEKSKNKAKIDHQNYDKTTALMIACDAGQVAVVKYFLDKKAKVSLVDWEGKTALHYAADSGSTEVLGLLLNKKADINAQTKLGWTALMEAVAEGKQDAVMFLISKGADLNKKASGGFSRSSNEWSAQFAKDDTALSISRTRNLSNIEKILLDAGAKAFYFSTLNNPIVKEKLGSCDVEIDLADKVQFNDFMTILKSTYKGDPNEKAEIAKLNKIKFEDKKFIILKFKFSNSPGKGESIFTVYDSSLRNLNIENGYSYKNTFRLGTVITGYQEVLLFPLLDAVTKKNFPDASKPVMARLSLFKEYNYTKYFYPE